MPDSHVVAGASFDGHHPGGVPLGSRCPNGTPPPGGVPLGSPFPSGAPFEIVRPGDASQAGADAAGAPLGEPFTSGASYSPLPGHAAMQSDARESIDGVACKR